MNKFKTLKLIKNQLIISCQAVDDEPLNNVTAIKLVAQACIMGGAKVLRLSQVNHIKAIKPIANSIPIIGLIKKHYDNSEVFITPTLKEVKQLINLKINAIAIDATNNKRPNQSLEQLIKYLQINAHNVITVADIATIDDVINANQLGFDLISTTLVGNTKKTKGNSNIKNNYEFVKQCLKVSQIPIIAEGGIWTPDQVKDLLSLGCFAVVVGSAITRPLEITKYFLKALK